MGPMPLHVEWPDLLLRLALTIIAGGAIGYNRDQHGKAAGLRTTLLVALAASVSMIQVNLLLTTVGKQPDSFITNDLFRLPLGILSGMGFIGGGVILRKENVVVGVTTAATLWFVTVVGLCFGGGQLVLGAIATVIGLATLWGLKQIELRVRQEHVATLLVDTTAEGPTENDIRRRLAENGFDVRATRILSMRSEREFYFELRHMRKPPDTHTPEIVKSLAQMPGVAKIEWKLMS
jgi:putative Mg2+ transporter-C (MgtC) family protein